MNFAKYNNTYPYPSKADFTYTYYYKAGQLVATSIVDNLNHIIKEVELKDCTKEEDFDSIAFQLERRKYSENGDKLLEQFKADLADELGLTGHPKWDKLFSMAWDMGHGYQEVCDYASDLAELLY